MSAYVEVPDGGGRPQRCPLLSHEATTANRKRAKAPNCTTIVQLLAQPMSKTQKSLGNISDSQLVSDSQFKKNK